MDKRIEAMRKGYTIERTLQSMQASVALQAMPWDEHPEANWYNYEEECEEPVSISKESYTGAQVRQKVKNVAMFLHSLASSVPDSPSGSVKGNSMLSKTKRSVKRPKVKLDETLRID